LGDSNNPPGNDRKPGDTQYCNTMCSGIQDIVVESLSRIPRASRDCSISRLY
jgi:hypothetical protein